MAIRARSGSGEFSEAVREYDVSIKLKVNARALFGRGSYKLYTIDDVKGAEKDFLAAIAIEPSHQPSLMSLAWVEYEKGRYQKGETFFMNAYRADENPVCHEDYVLFQFKTQNYTRANDLITEYEHRYGSNYVSDGYRLILAMIKNTDSDHSVGVNQYSDRFGKEGVEWLNDVMQELNSL